MSSRTYWTRSRAAALSADALDSILAAYYADEAWELTPDEAAALEAEQEARDCDASLSPRDEPAGARDSSRITPSCGE